MPQDIEPQNHAGSESDLLSPVLIAQIASRLFNELPEAGSVPKFETDAPEAPSSFASSFSSPSLPAGEENHRNLHTDHFHQGLSKEPSLPSFSEELPLEQQPDLYFLSTSPEKKEEPLGHHANKLTEQQNYSEEKSSSNSLDEFIRRTLPAKPERSEDFSSANPESLAPFFTTLNSGLPGEDEFSFKLLYTAAQNPAKAHDLRPEGLPEPLPTSQTRENPAQIPAALPFGGECYAEKLYKTFAEGEGRNLDLGRVLQSLQGFGNSPAASVPGFAAPEGFQPTVVPFTPQASSPAELPGKAPAPVWPAATPPSPGSSALPFSLPDAPQEPYYFLRESRQPIHQPEGFDVATIRKDFPVLHQKIHGKQLVWFDNAATTQKPLSVINAVARFYATDNSNIHRGAHTLAARSTDAYEGAREKIRQFIGASSASEIIYVRGTTEGINLVAQTWGRKFLQPGDEIILSILEHHANIVPWQMVAQEKGARIRVVPVNDRGEIILEEYTKLLNPRTKLVSLTQASNGLGTILPIREMIQLAKRFDAKVLIDGAQSVAHIPVNVQNLDADFFVFSGHKIFAPTGIGVVYGKRELLEVMPPWQGGGNMIKDVRFEETIYNEAPAKFEAGTPSIGDAIGLGAALDYVRKIGLENIANYEHRLTEYGTERLSSIPGLRLIGTARDKVGVLSFVLNNLPNDEVGKLLDREGIAVRTGHHCTQPSLRRFGVEGTIRPSLAFYNTFEEIDRLADVVRHIQRR